MPSLRSRPAPNDFPGSDFPPKAEMPRAPADGSVTAGITV